MKLVPTLLLILAVASPAHALEHSLIFSGGYGKLGGDDFEGLESGPTVGVRYSARVWSNLFAGIGADISAYGFEIDDDELRQLDAIASLRWYIPVGRWSLFVDGFGGYSRYSFPTAVGDATADGWLLGSGVGLAIPVGGAFIDLAVEANHQAYGAARINGTTVEGADFSGHRSLARASLRFAVPSPPQPLEHWFTYSLGYGTLGGDDFEGLDPGPSMGIRYSARVWPRLYAGLAGDLSRYDFEDDDTRLWQTDAMATLRWYVPVGSWALFVDGSGGYSQYSIRTVEGKLTARGLLWGAALGVAIPVNGAFIDVSVDANQQAYGNIGGGTEPVEPEEIEARENSDTSGYRSVVRIGLRIPLGN